MRERRKPSCTTHKSDIENGDFDWIDRFGRIALAGGETNFEQYSEPLARWYRVHVYDNGHCVQPCKSVLNRVSPRKQNSSRLGWRAQEAGVTESWGEKQWK